MWPDRLKSRKTDYRRVVKLTADLVLVWFKICYGDISSKVFASKIVFLKMETAALVAPVTALEFLQDAFLLTGERRC